MVSRKVRRTRKEARRYTEKLFEKHRRHNDLFARPGVHDCIIVLDNLKPTFNIGKIFRSGDAFGVRQIHLVGTDYFDAKAAKGSFKWVPAVFHEKFETCYSYLKQEDYGLFILEPSAALPLHHAALPRKSAFIFGHEEFGVSFDPEHYPEIRKMKVAQFGRVESLNVSIAASIVMYEYSRQHPPA